jgi:hypothetical protein
MVSVVVWQAQGHYQNMSGSIRAGGWGWQQCAARIVMAIHWSGAWLFAPGLLPGTARLFVATHLHTRSLVQRRGLCGRWSTCCICGP